MKTLEILDELLRFKSITPSDDGAMNYISMLMEEFESISVDVGDTKNLILMKKFGDGEHLCFAGHIDVVKPGDGWDSNPFVPVKKEGYIYARGAQDMKGGLAAFLSAAKEAHKTRFKGTLSMIITSDEEGDGKNGTIKALEYMKEHNILPSYAIVAEPTCAKSFGDTIKIGRRGSLNGVLTIKGKQGHAAYPANCVNPVHQLAQVFSHFAGHDLDNGDEYFEPSKIVVVDIRGGDEVVNKTPHDVRVMFNVRNSAKTSLEDIKNYVAKVFFGLEYELKIEQTSKSYLSNKDSKIVRTLSLAIEKNTNQIAQLSTTGGTSDARHLSEFGISVVEFGTINDTIHQSNERVKESEVLGLKKIFLDVIDNF